MCLRDLPGRRGSDQNLNLAVPVDDLQTLAERPEENSYFGPLTAGPWDYSSGEERTGSITPRLLSAQKVIGELAFLDLECNDGERANLYCFFGSEGEVVRIRMPSDAIDSYISLMTVEGDNSYNTFAKTRSARHGGIATAAESLRQPNWRADNGDFTVPDLSGQ